MIEKGKRGRKTREVEGARRGGKEREKLDTQNYINILTHLFRNENFGELQHECSRRDLGEKEE